MALGLASQFIFVLSYGLLTDWCFCVIDAVCAPPPRSSSPLLVGLIDFTMIPFGRFGSDSIRILGLAALNSVTWTAAFFCVLFTAAILKTRGSARTAAVLVTASAIGALIPGSIAFRRDLEVMRRAETDTATLPRPVRLSGSEITWLGEPVASLDSILIVPTDLPFMIYGTWLASDSLAIVADTTLGVLLPEFPDIEGPLVGVVAPLEAHSSIGWVVFDVCHDARFLSVGSVTP